MDNFEMGCGGRYSSGQIDRMMDALIEMSATKGFWTETPLQRVSQQLLREMGHGSKVDAYKVSAEAERYRLSVTRPA